MTLHRKHYGTEVFVIFGGYVYKAEVQGVNTNVRGCVTGKSVFIRRTAADDKKTNALGFRGTQTDIKKAYIFTDEESANKALFKAKLKGEIQ